MNKTDLNEILKLTKQLEKAKKDNDFLLKQQNKFREMAEKAGSEAAAYKIVVERLKDELETLESTLKRFE